jgi:hypothetical protein
LKILIQGQEVDTLAGHLDLTRTFLVNAKAVPMTAASAPPADSAKPPASAAPGGKTAAAAATPSKSAAKQQTLTPASPPGKLTQPVKKP